MRSKKYFDSNQKRQARYHYFDISDHRVLCSEKYQQTVNKFLSCLFPETTPLHQYGLVAPLLYKEVYRFFKNGISTTLNLNLKERCVNSVSIDLDNLNLFYSGLLYFKKQNPHTYIPFSKTGRQYPQYPFSTRRYQAFLASIDYGVTLFFLSYINYIATLYDDKLLQGETMFIDTKNNPWVIGYKEGATYYKYQDFIDTVYLNIVKSSKQTKLLDSINSPFDDMPANFDSLIKKLSANIKVASLPAKIKSSIDIMLPPLMEEYFKEIRISRKSCMPFAMFDCTVSEGK